MKNNIILIGMPGAGKSTLGVLAAKALNYRFMDTDLCIQEHTGKLLYETINEKGIDEFLKIEQNVLKEVKCDRTIVATGGSAVYGPEAMAHLAEIGTIVYIQLTCEEVIRRVNNITTRGIAMKAGKTMKDVYEERTPLYEKYAEITIACDGKSVEECVSEIVEAVKTTV